VPPIRIQANKKMNVSPGKTLCRLGNWAEFVLLFSLSVQTAVSQTTYEAESAVRSNGAKAADCSFCSGGQQVQNIGGPDNGTVTFDQVQVPRGGLYPMTVSFNVGDDRAASITVNGSARFDVVFHPRAGADQDSSQTVLVPLNAGTNSIAFNNAREFAPNLDDIVIGGSPAESFGISGSVKNSDGAPLPGVEVFLSGLFMQMKTVTDAQGDYKFPFLPNGDYYIRPQKAETFFSPYERICPASATSAGNQDFTAAKLTTRQKDVSVMQLGRWRIEYDLVDGLADFFLNGKMLIQNAFAEVRLPQAVTSMDYQSRKVTQEAIHDGFGRGVKCVVESSGGRADKMIQTFWLYQNADYFLTEVKISQKPKAASNFMAPLVTQTPSHFLAAGDNRALFVPFDNDKWVRYEAVPFGNEVTSYEVSALYNNTSRRGLIVGSIEHDTWKTGIRSTTASNAVTSLEVFGGISSSETRDVLPHGKISGKTVKSPKIFVGCFSDWRNGLDAYAKANAVVAPPRIWEGGVPFGWNSWGKLQFGLTFSKAVQVSDFFAQELPQFENHGVAYIGLDAGWNKFSDQELKQFVEHCEANHQEAGIYFTPFTAWGAKDDEPVPGTSCQYKDIFLYAHGRKQHIASGMALDPTHPGTQRLIQDSLKKFKKAGFKYVKADFLNYGALEADRYYNPRVTTGIQAYSEGMKYVSRTLGRSRYLNLSIAPLFPSQYANSRRIGCDAFGAIGDTEYTLNSLTYGWWLDGAYDFNDPDEIVLDGFSEGENRARVTSAAITGLFISGDDFSRAGDALGKERAKKFLTNPEIDAVARIPKSFQPVEGDTGSRAANLFARQDKNHFYLAAFNYSDRSADLNVDFRRIGLQTHRPVEAKELWSGAVIQATNSMTIQLAPADAALYEFCGKPELK
jgi:alpha-galactosidase